MRSLLAALLLAGACGPKPAAPPPVLGIDMSDESVLPTPFTAEQIREAMPLGTRLQLRLSAGEVTVMTMHWEVLAADAETMTLLSHNELPDGKQAEPETHVHAWEDLRDHAAYKARQTTRRRHSMQTALGELEGWLYEVNAPGRIESIFFADALPGPPTWMEQTSADGATTLLEQVVRETASSAPSTP